MGRWEIRVPNVPWSDIEASDLCEANQGELELYRDTQVGPLAERHVGMHVVGQYDSWLSLGILAIRCERKGRTLIPVSMAIADTPPAHPALLCVQSNPQRHADPDDQC